MVGEKPTPYAPGKEEESQAHNPAKLGHGGQKRLDENLHRRHGRQTPERSEQPEGPQSRHASHGRDLLHHGRHDDEEVEPVPRVG